MQRMDNASIIAIQPYGDPNSKTINIRNAPEMIGCYPTWNIYNRQYTDTGIEISNNDYLSIAWGGNIIIGNGLTIPFIDLSRAKMLASGDQWIFRNFSNDKSISKVNFLQAMSSLEFENLGVLVGETGAPPQKNGDDDNTQICNGKKVYESLNTKEAFWHGLSGQIDRKSGNDPKDTNNKHPDKYFKFTCPHTFLFPDRYIFSGILSDVNKTMQLRLRHYIPQSGLEQSVYANSILNGGYQVTIEWGGCPIKDGQGLEYALSDDKMNPEDIKTWKKIDLSKSSGFTFIPINTKDSNITVNETYDPKKYTKVFLRVNPEGLSRNNGFKPDGSYTLKINGTSDVSKEYIPWYDLTKNIALSIFQTLIGNPSMINNHDIKLDGVLIQVFNALSQSIAPLIQIVLVFYVTMLGLGFMIGTIKTTQHELVVIMFKLSLVFLVFSENGRAFFVDAYIRIFIIGIMRLAHIMQNSVYEVLSSYGGENYNPNPDNKDDVFNIFSMWEMWSYMLKKSFTKRLLALMFSSMSGFVIALIILGSSIISIFTLLKAIMYYISSMITQGILLLIAPFFFLLNLFKITSAMFQEWTKQVIAFALAPIAITITVTLFMLLLVIGIEATMGFSYCIGCLVEMFGSCVIPTFYTLNVMFMPIDTSTSFILPIGLFAGTMSFLIIAYAGKSAVDLGFGIIMRLVTFRFETAGRSVMGDIGINSAMSGLSGIAEAGRGIIGDRNLNPFKSNPRQDSWTSDFGKKNIDIALRDEKKLDEIGQKLKDLDIQPQAQNPQQGNGGNNPPGGGGGNP